MTGKLFGVDGSRPLHADVFESIALDLGRLNTVKDDTTGLGTDHSPPYVQQIQIVTDKVFRAVLNLNTASILGARADRIEVGSRARRLDCALYGIATTEGLAVLLWTRNWRTPSHSRMMRG